MARTQAADYDQRRAAIVSNAARLFARSGFASASVAGLAQACKTSKSLIYHYYPSKEEVLYAVMAGHLEILEQDVSEALSTGGSAKDRLTAIVHRFMQHYVGAADAHKVLLNELDSLPSALRAELVAQQRRIIDSLTSVLQEIFSSLAQDNTRARVAAMLLFGMINWTHTWYDPTGPVSPDDLADMALAMALREPLV